jgi:hypothetical protein
VFKDTARPHSLGPYALVRPGTPVAWPGNVADPRTAARLYTCSNPWAEKEHAPLTRLICLSGEQGAGPKFKDLSGSAHFRPRARAIRHVRIPRPRVCGGLCALPRASRNFFEGHSPLRGGWSADGPRRPPSGAPVPPHSPETYAAVRGGFTHSYRPKIKSDPIMLRPP